MQRISKKSFNNVDWMSVTCFYFKFSHKKLVVHVKNPARSLCFSVSLSGHVRTLHICIYIVEDHVPFFMYCVDTDVSLYLHKTSDKTENSRHLDTTSHSANRWP